MHSHCASAVCLPDGKCGDSRDVAYVDAKEGSGSACTQETPCSLLSTALAADRSYVKITGLVQDNVTIKGFVTILADPGAQLKALSPGPVVQIADQSSVSIYDLEITGAQKGGAADVDADGITVPVPGSAKLDLTRVKITRNASHGLFVFDGTVNVTQSTFSNNDIGAQTSRGNVDISESIFSDNVKQGLWASGPGTVSVTRSMFRNNKHGVGAAGDQQPTGILRITRSTITGNREGGIALFQTSTKVVITNNFIVRNGTSGAGGIWGFPTSDSEIKFNTIADNVALPTGGAGGIECKNTVDVTNNLIVRNTGGPSNPQLTPECKNVGSYLSNSGANTPGFVRPDTDPYDYHLSTSTPSTIRDKVSCASIDKDFDGDARPIAGNCDVGADEYNGP